MDYLDFGAIMENNEWWFEEYDLSCPFCNSSGEMTKLTCICENEDYDEEIDEPEEKGCGYEWEVVGEEDEVEEPDECPKCGNDMIQVDEEGVSCEECGGQGMFEVMWNTAFSINLPFNANREEVRKFLWDHGFCLIDHKGKDYMLMGSCGADMTWRIHWVRWKVSEHLSKEEVYDCLGSGGYCFLRDEEIAEMCEYFKTVIPTPEQYASGYQYDMTKIDRIQKKKGIA